MEVLDIFPRVLVYCLSGSHESYVDELWSCLTPIAAIIIIIIRARVQRGKVALSETAAFAWRAQSNPLAGLIIIIINITVRYSSYYYSCYIGQYLSLFRVGVCTSQCFFQRYLLKSSLPLHCYQVLAHGVELQLILVGDNGKVITIYKLKPFEEAE